MMVSLLIDGCYVGFNHGFVMFSGAVCFGLDPTVVHVRKSRLTYGVGVLNRYVKVRSA